MFNPEDELQQALDEVKKNEKDLNMIVIIASTLFEKCEDTSSKLTMLNEENQGFLRKQDELLQINDSLQGEINSIAKQQEANEQMKSDLEYQVQSLNIEKETLEGRNLQLENLINQLQDENIAKSQLLEQTQVKNETLAGANSGNFVEIERLKENLMENSKKWESMV